MSWVLGGHIEMTAEAGVDYEQRAAAHANERELHLRREHLIELNEALRGMGARVRHEVRSDFIVVPR